MVRTLGAVDLKQRLRRKDKGKHRKLYRGKPVKGKRQKIYERKRGNTSVLKLWIWDYVPMTSDGRRRWNKWTRAYACPYVCPADRRLRVDVDVSDISNKEKMEDFVAWHMWEGTFYVMGFSHGKNKKRVKPVKLCKVIVKETQSGNVGRMVRNYRLSRYWFWNK